MWLFGWIPVDAVSLSLAALAALYLYFTWSFDYWKKRNVPSEKPTIFFGNFKDAVFSRTTIGMQITDLYRKYEGKPFVGIWRFSRPGLLVRDLELVKTVLQKDFNNFQENGFRVDPELDPLVGRNPFFQVGAQWRNTRSILTPVFTSGKIKPLFPLMEEVSNEMVEYLRDYSTTCGPGGVNAKDLAAKFTIENVASCVFGIKGNSFKDPNAELMSVARTVLEPGLLRNLEFLLLNFVPALSDILKLSLVPKDADRVFRKIVGDVVSHRERTKISRNDFVQQLILLKKKAMEEAGDFDFTMDDIVGHSVTFLTDGFETSAITISFALHELAVDQAVQSALRDEVDEAYRSNDGHLSNELIMEQMPYLDQVVQETLRLHTPVMWMEKVCTGGGATLRAEGGSEVRLDEGTLVVIPVRGLHTDPAFFPDPDRFDPARFAPGRREAIPKFAFLPFGEGPRMCLGMRFALAQVKLALASIVRHFVVETTPKTPNPIVQDPHYFLRAAKGGLWVKFVRRENIPS